MNDTISTTKSIDGDFIKKNIKVPAKVTLKYRLSAPLASTPMKTTTQRENPWSGRELCKRVSSVIKFSIPGR